MKKRTVLITALSLAIAAGIGAVIYNQLPIWTTPEPEVCVLHSHRDDFPPFLAPALMDLSTGKICELNPYQRDPDDPSKLGEVKTGIDEMRLFKGAIVTVLSDDRVQALMTEPAEPIDYTLYCRECRKILTRAGRSGCVLLDLHDFDARKAYAIRRGADYSINGFSVEIDNYSMLANQEYVETCLRVRVGLNDENLLASKKE